MVSLDRVKDSRITTKAPRIGVGGFLTLVVVSAAVDPSRSRRAGPDGTRTGPGDAILIPTCACDREAEIVVGVAPIGPGLTTLDELDNPKDLAIEAVLDEETVQSGRTKQMMFDVAALVADLSGICELSPDELIFTSAPAGVGYSRTPHGS